MSSLKSDDGTPLEVKEGVVLDQDGNPLTPPPRSDSQDFSFNGARVIKVQGFWLWVIGMLVPVLLVAGVAFGLVFFAVAILFWTVATLVRALTRSR